MGTRTPTRISTRVRGSPVPLTVNSSALRRVHGGPNGPPRARGLDIDLSAVTFVGTGAVGVLLSGRNAAHRAGCG